MTKTKWTVFLFLAPSLALAQQPSANPTTLADPETVVVTGTLEPIPLSESNRTVVSFDTEENTALTTRGLTYIWILLWT